MAGHQGYKEQDWRNLPKTELGRAVQETLQNEIFPKVEPEIAKTLNAQVEALMQRAGITEFVSSP